MKIKYISLIIILFCFLCCNAFAAPKELDNDSDDLMDADLIIDGSAQDNCAIRFSEEGADDNLQPSYLIVDDNGSCNIPSGQSYKVNGSPIINDTAYDASSWDGDTTTAPSKNTIRDKIENLAIKTSYYLSSYDHIDDAATTLNALNVDCELIIDPGDTMDASASFDPEVFLRFVPGDGNTITTTGYTLTVDSPANIIAGPRQLIFEGTGDVTYTNPGVIYAGWYAAGDGTDESAELQTMIDGAGTVRGFTFAFPTTTTGYGVGTALVLPQPPTTNTSRFDWTFQGHGGKAKLIATAAVNIFETYDITDPNPGTQYWSKGLTFRDLELDGDDTGTNGFVLQGTAQNTTIDNCIVHNFTNAGLYAIRMIETAIINPYFYSSAKYQIYTCDGSTMQIFGGALRFGEVGLHNDGNLTEAGSGNDDGTDDLSLYGTVIESCSKYGTHQAAGNRALFDHVHFEDIGYGGDANSRCVKVSNDGGQTTNGIEFRYSSFGVNDKAGGQKIFDIDNCARLRFSRCNDTGEAGGDIGASAANTVIEYGIDGDGFRVEGNITDSGSGTIFKEAISGERLKADTDNYIDYPTNNQVRIARSADATILNAYISSGGSRESNQLFNIRLDGELRWGAGGASVLDVSLERLAANGLDISSTAPKLTLQDDDGADGFIANNAADAADGVMTLGVDDSNGDDQTYIELDGVNERIEAKYDLLLEAALISDGNINVIPSGDSTDYLRFYTTSNVPYISTVGACDLYINPSSDLLLAPTDTVRISPSGDSNDYFTFSTTSDVPRIDTPLSPMDIAALSNIDMFPSGDEDDYFRFSTTSDEPTITTVGSCNLNIGSSSGEVNMTSLLNQLTATFAFTTEADITDPLPGNIVHLDGDDDSDDDTIDLQDGETAGQTVTFIAYADIDTDDAVIISMADTTCNNCVTTIRFIRLGDSMLLEWDGSAWNMDNAQKILNEGAFENGDKTKLDNIEDGANVTDTTNVTAAGARMDSEYTSAALTVDSDPEQITSGSGVFEDIRRLSGDADGYEIELLETNAFTGQIMKLINEDDEDIYHIDDTSSHVENPNNKTVYMAPGDMVEYVYSNDRWYYTNGGYYDIVVDTIQANANVITDADGITLTSDQMRSVIYMTGGGDVDIPDGECDGATDVGNWLVVKTSADDQNSLTSLDASNQFILADLTALTAGNELDIDGNMVCVMCIAVEKWAVTGYLNGAPTDGGGAD